MPDIFNSMADFESWFEFSSAVGQQEASQVGAQCAAILV